MKERPILFSAPMVQALLAGTKTQTRRLLKPQPVSLPDFNRGGLSICIGGSKYQGFSPSIPPIRCPYGQPGDRLWVREKWSADPPIDDSWASTEWNGCGRKVREIPERFHHPRFCNYAADWLHEPIRWTPSIHMPRWASRILLGITAVRVERLQDISEADATTEGIGRYDNGTFGLDDPGACMGLTASIAYMRLWESINGPGSWAANPWVWCIEFKRVTP